MSRASKPLRVSNCITLFFSIYISLEAKMSGTHAEDDQPMSSLLDKHVFFKHLEKFHFILTMEEEIGAVENAS